MLGHIILISAQVNSRTRRAGARGGDLRRRSPRCSAPRRPASSGVARRLERLRRPAQRAAPRTRSCKRQLGERADRSCSSSARWPIAAAALEQLLELREQHRRCTTTAAEVIGGGADARVPDRDDRQGHAATACGADMAVIAPGGRRRPGRRAERARGEGAAAHRPQRRGRRARSSARARRASSSAPATSGCAWSTCRRSPTSRSATSS